MQDAFGPVGQASFGRKRDEFEARQKKLRNRWQSADTAASSSARKRGQPSDGRKPWKEQGLEEEEHKEGKKDKTREQGRMCPRDG